MSQSNFSTFIPQNFPRFREIKNFLALYGWDDQPMIALQRDASPRTYYRLGSDLDQTCILMDCPPGDTSIYKFKDVDKALEDMRYSVPEILSEDLHRGLLLLEDFGDLTFSRALEAGTDEKFLYETAIDVLIDLHQKSRVVIRDSFPPYTLEILLGECTLFIDWYYPQIFNVSLPEEARMEWENLWIQLLAPYLKESFIVLRDYHVDNLMWLSNRTGLQQCGLLDFQDAVLGARSYDVVSLLEDARRDIPEALQKQMLKRYLDAFPKLDKNDFLKEYYIFGAHRSSKIIGIFTRLAFRDKKDRYLSFIPRVWKILENDLNHPALESLRSWFDRHIPSTQRKLPK